MNEKILIGVILLAILVLIVAILYSRKKDNYVVEPSLPNVCPFQRIHMNNSGITCQYDIDDNCNDSNFVSSINIPYNIGNCQWSTECRNDQWNNSNTKIMPCSVICEGDKKITCPLPNSPEVHQAFLSEQKLAREWQAEEQPEEQAQYWGQ
jgi:hypothetical protein